MPELDKLVENYFAPRSKTFTKQMLYEIFDEVSNEEEDMVQRAASQLLQTLSGDYPEVKLKSLPRTSSGTIYITNMGGPKKRHAAVKQIADAYGIEKNSEKKYRESDYNIGATLSSGVRFVLKNGRNTLAKENISLEELQDLLKSLAVEHGLENMRIKFSDNMGDDGAPRGQKSVFYDVAPNASNIPKTPKADFVIGDPQEGTIYISHKDGKSPKAFGQWSGISEKSGFNKEPEVKNFGKLLARVMKDLEIQRYPNKIDFQKRIADPDLILKAVFGKEHNPKEPSSPDNVDFVLQGKINLVPELDENGEPTEVFDIQADKVFGANFAERDITTLENFFSDGYFPVLSARYATKRRSFDIVGARATIYPEGGRDVNFLFTADSRPTDFDFVPITLNPTQFKNAQGFFNSLDVGMENETYRKMHNSITNFSD